jgi:hypothetical protein
MQYPNGQTVLQYPNGQMVQKKVCTNKFEKEKN